ncbi:flagellin [Sphingomonas sp. ST-64]|uniref:Flagellin n=1 Tax=Sphingomonas plantiphila TaxID=3163295 RepID=A0ABW8YNA5_9SPHN
MRVATIPLQQTTANAIQRAQQKLAVTQAQLSTGKKAPDLAALGSEAVRTLSAHTLLAKQEAHATNATRLGTTLSLYETAITSIENTTMDLGNRVLQAIGTGEAAGLDEAISATFDQFRSMLNASEGGLPLFGGGIAGEPFTAVKIEELIGTDPADHFVDGKAKARARVGDGLDLNYGITATEIGAEVTEIYRQLVEAGPFDEQLNDAQKDVLRGIKDRLDDAVSNVRRTNAENGRRLAQTETLVDRANDRALVLKDVISRNEDADLAQVAMDLAQHKTALEASYSVFSQLNQLSLLSYLR